MKNEIDCCSGSKYVINDEPGVPDQSSRQQKSQHVLFDTTRTKLHFNTILCKTVR